MPIFVADEVVTAAKLNLATARDWATWSPTIGGLTTTSGTIVARYGQIGETVIVQFQFTLGSSSAVTGDVTVSTPVTAALSSIQVGTATLQETGVALHVGTVDLSATTTLRVRRQGVSGANVVASALTSTTPFTWGTTDIIAFTAVYEVA